MIIDGKKIGEELHIFVNGKLNTDTAPMLETFVKEQMEKRNVRLEANADTGEDAIGKVIFDFTQVEYVSSAGLRVVMNTYKQMNKVKDAVKVRGANSNVKEVFRITGFDKFLVIE